MTGSSLPVTSSLSLSVLSPRHSEILSEALAEAKCAGLALSDPCPRRRQAPSFGSRGFARLSDPYEISVSLEFLVLLFQDKSTWIKIFFNFSLRSQRMQNDLFLFLF
jgi:hypothetical protein